MKTKAATFFLLLIVALALESCGLVRVYTYKDYAQADSTLTRKQFKAKFNNCQKHQKHMFTVLKPIHYGGPGCFVPHPPREIPNAQDKKICGGCVRGKPFALVKRCTACQKEYRKYRKYRKENPWPKDDDN